ncbi:MAG: N(4)-(beta-N-acetylglucosaminyl)-L-asparaginase [Acidobacteriota bacterium]|nr:N(4)-(beta-N-acetylglucosaminyl)-L-asparaginase [Blastocatellia bacterium]MDW8413089.1 N(4)-(beta-N-acetylglucosaminyl)-L-asparaginase [Acidobacteriota bacterium]
MSAAAVTANLEVKQPPFLIVSSANGLSAMEQGVELLRKGNDALDAVIAVVSAVEDDPEEMSVGYGGLPNADGEVELDASVMHGPTRSAGAVAALKYIKNPSKVARLVMERTGHLMLVGEGALKFALANGFRREELLTKKSREIWLKWRELQSDKGAWRRQLETVDVSVAKIISNPPTGTITCFAKDLQGGISGVTSTSGLAFKMAGRVGDSPLIGAGLYVDNDVGAAGATGRGEECIKVAGAYAVVECMRRGAMPEEACLEVLKRVSARYNHDRSRLKTFNLQFYALDKHARHGSAVLWLQSDKERPKYAVSDGKAAVLRNAAWLYEAD